MRDYQISNGMVFGRRLIRVTLETAADFLFNGEIKV